MENAISMEKLEKPKNRKKKPSTKLKIYNYKYRFTKSCSEKEW